MEEYNITLQYPNLPVINVAPANRSAVWIPAELFRVLPNQHFHGKLSDKHTAEMITFACQPPNINAQAIVGTGIPALGLHASDPAPILEQFGLSVGNEMAVVPGRVLPAPGIVYNGQGRAKIKDGGWNLRDVKFVKSATMPSWAVLAIRDGGDLDFQSATDPALLGVVRGLANMCRTSGMNVDKKDPPIVAVDISQYTQRSRKVAAISEAIRQNFRLARPRIIVVMLSSGDKYVYAGIKKECDINLDILCVCAQSSKIRKEKGQPQYFANLALKLNAKLGGINHALGKPSLLWLQRETTMFMGSDVTHPGPDSMKGTPSIAAVVGNVDEGFCQYPASLRIQKSKKEASFVYLLSDLVSESDPYP